MIGFYNSLCFIFAALVAIIIDWSIGFYVCLSLALKLIRAGPYPCLLILSSIAYHRGRAPSHNRGQQGLTLRVDGETPWIGVRWFITAQPTASTDYTNSGSQVPRAMWWPKYILPMLFYPRGTQGQGPSTIRRRALMRLPSPLGTNRSMIASVVALTY